MELGISSREAAGSLPDFRDVVSKYGLLDVFGILVLLLFFICSIVVISHRNLSTVAAALDDSLVGSSKQIAIVIRSNLREEISTLALSPSAQSELFLKSERLSQVLSVMLADTPLLKAKIFNREGEVVFSTNAADVGRLSGELSQFKTASSGGHASVIKVRSTRDFSIAPEQLGSPMHVISTYVPLANTLGDSLYGYVLKTYSDVTAGVVLAEKSVRLSLITSLLIAMSLGCLIIACGRYRFRKQRELNLQGQAHAEILLQQATTDHLTKTGNRTAFEQALSELSSRATAGGSACLISIDVDDFKRVNDLYGHKIGDELLECTAAIIRRCADGKAALFRTGGDEFVLLGAIGPDKAKAIAQCIVTAFSEPLQISNLKLKQSVTMGIAQADWVTDEPGGEERLLLEADLALIHAKAENRNSYSVYQRGMSAGRVVSAKQNNELSIALAERQFILHYQPRVDMNTEAIESVEALVRWQHPEKGLLYPNEFIPCLEKSGLITGLSTQVLDQCCDFLLSNRELLGDAFRVSINISPAELNDLTLHHKFEQILVARDVQARRFEIEVTESILLSDRRKFAEAINKFRDMGFSLSVDDFGIGYSNLRQLYEIGPESLKIDRSLIEGITQDKQMQMIVKYVADLGASMGAAVVVEGVETAEQLACVRSLGCRFAQGFFFEKALPAEQLLPKINHRYAC